MDETPFIDNRLCNSYTLYYYSRITNYDELRPDEVGISYLVNPTVPGLDNVFNCFSPALNMNSIVLNWLRVTSDVPFLNSVRTKFTTCGRTSGGFARAARRHLLYSESTCFCNPELIFFGLFLLFFCALAAPYVMRFEISLRVHFS